MKKLVATLCVVGSAFALSACTTEGSGEVDQAPYAMERTAGYQAETPAPAQRSEQVFTRSQQK